MARFRCVFIPTITPSGRQSDDETSTEALYEIAYEFEAPDLPTLRDWLTKAPIPTGALMEIEELPADEPASARRFPA